jgi:3-isopropylmalate/(R)-2-methylmalate dehydratase small subunit
MDKFLNIQSRVMVLPVNDVDTDQIIPARFLKVTDKNGLGANLFFNWRFLADGSDNPEFVLNKPESRGAEILVAGNNFGCGSSREHAPWALVGYGFRAVISTSIADIFRSNSLKNGFLPIVLTAEDYATLRKDIEVNPQAELTIDLGEQVVKTSGGSSFSFPIDPFSKTCLLEGIDELGYLLKLDPQISSFEQKAGAG